MTEAMSNLEANVGAGNVAEAEPSELWHVQLADGEVKLWSLDQLDAAFQAELVNERTHVLQDGTMEWVKLGDLLGLDGGSPESQAPESFAPVDSSATPGPVSVSPVSIAAPVSVAPPSAVAYSIRPVADLGTDLGDDLDLDAMSMRPKKRGLFIGLAAAALVLVGIGAAVSAGGESTPPAAAVAAAAAAALPPVVPTPVAAPQAAPPPAPADSPATPSADTRFSDSQRKALLDADKARDTARKARAASAPHRSSHISSKPVFHKGGNKYDPLNSQL